MNGLGSVDRDLTFGHRLQEAALRTWGGAIDLVGEHEVGKERARLESERGALLVVDGDAGDVARQQVAGELHASKGEIERPCERLGKSRLADTRHVFEQQMPASRESGQGQLDHRFLALERAGDVAFQRGGKRLRLLGFEGNAKLRYFRR